MTKLCCICNDKNVSKQCKKRKWYCKNHLDLMESEIFKDEYKRVIIPVDQYWRAYKRAGEKGMKVSNYLASLINNDSKTPGGH
jgi:hypothetical protein